MKAMTEETAMLRLADYCAKGEHCSSELIAKLAQWGIAESATLRILDELHQRKYFDDERYARALVRDKIAYNKWGRRKIEQTLWQKSIADDIRQRVLGEVADEEYLDALRPLLRQKRKTTRAADGYELNQKLIRFALSRGFTFDIIRQCLDVDDEAELVD